MTCNYIKAEGPCRTGCGNSFTGSLTENINIRNDTGRVDSAFRQKKDAR